MLREIMYAQTRAEAERGIDTCVGELRSSRRRRPCLAKDRAALLTYFDFPAEQLIMAFKLIEMAQDTLAQAQCRTPITARARGHEIRRWRSARTPS